MKISQATRGDFFWATGRIFQQDSLWVLVDDRPDVIELLAEKKYHAETENGHRVLFTMTPDGKLSKLLKGRSTKCPNPDLWPDAYRSSEDGRAWIAIGKCRGCKFYRTAKQSGQNYPICQWAQDQRCQGQPPERVAARRSYNRMIDSFKAANQMVKDWMG